jgi:hypothetical protein
MRTSTTTTCETLKGVTGATKGGMRRATLTDVTLRRVKTMREPLKGVTQTGCQGVPSLLATAA